MAEQLVKAVQQYVTGRSSLEALVSQAKFATMVRNVDGDIGEDAANELYNALHRQNDTRLREVNYRIKKELNEVNVAASDVDRAGLHDRDTLESIIKDLSALNDDILRQRVELETALNSKLSEINSRVDDLSDLKYGKFDFMSSIQDSLESLDRLEKVLLARIDKESDSAEK